jgi:hypothetical protein
VVVAVVVVAVAAAGGGELPIKVAVAADKAVAGAVVGAPMVPGKGSGVVVDDMMLFLVSLQRYCIRLSTSTVTVINSYSSVVS